MSSTSDSAVAVYKTLLAEILDRRPSGTRQRLATALAKNRSFISQICNPAYATPIPAIHLDALFETCHFSTAERQRFMAAYDLAHPKRVVSGRKPSQISTHVVQLPDLGDAARNTRLQALVHDFVHQLAHLFTDEPSKGKHP